MNSGKIPPLPFHYDLRFLAAVTQTQPKLN